jgi:hypothetical protein
MEHATRASKAEKDTLLCEVVVLMKKATELSTAAIECHQQLDIARIALANRREQLVATSDVIAGAVCRGFTKAWGTLQFFSNIRKADGVADLVQTFPEAREVTQPVDVLSSTLPHSFPKQPSQEGSSSGDSIKSRRCQSCPGRLSNIPSVAMKEANKDLDPSIVEGGNGTSFPAPGEPVYSTTMEEPWPGSSSGADTSADDSSEDLIRIKATPESVPTSRDDTQKPRDRASSM